jgi:integrase
MAEQHELMGGKLHVYQRDHSTNWQASTYLNGKNWRVSTKQDSLRLAIDFAEDWYLGLRGKARNGELKTGKKFSDAGKHFLHEYVTLIESERSPFYVKSYEMILRVHLVPFFGEKVLSEITPGLVQDYRVKRTQTKTHLGGSPSRSTLHKEIVVLRQILKFSNRHGWIPYVPDLSPPYKASGKISHRAWFSHAEYKQLYEATGKRAKQPLHNRHRWACEQFHDFVLFMANTGLRPDEAHRLEYRDVTVVKDDDTKDTILEIEVRAGKRGEGWCKSTPQAVFPFKRMVARNKPKPTDRLFPSKNHHRELMNTILEELKLKFDRNGARRTSYSLRHTYICFRLMEGADIYQIAKNCRTSVEMIEKFYAAHIKNTLDASAINVRKPKRRKRNEPLEEGAPTDTSP